MNVEAKKVFYGSPDRFGYEWSKFCKILPESKVQLERWLGNTTLSSFRGKRVLDVGCGMGRNPYWFAKSGAEVIGIDVDDRSLNAARKNCSELPEVQIKKCSVYDLDSFQWGTLDRVTCIGVLHHLDDPKLALRKMWNVLAPGGELLVWCYAHEGNEMLIRLIQFLRMIGSRIPIPLTHLMAKFFTAIVWLALRVFPWKVEYYLKLRTLSYKNIECIILDQLIPRIANYWTRTEIESLTRTVDGEVKIEFVLDNSWFFKITKHST